MVYHSRRDWHVKQRRRYLWQAVFRPQLLAGKYDKLQEAMETHLRTVSTNADTLLQSVSAAFQ